MTEYRAAMACLCGVLATMPRAGVAQQEFERCVAGLRITAEQRGVSPTTAATVTANVRQLERVIQSDRSQPEFVDTFARYLGRRVTEQRVAAGRESLQRHAALLDGIAVEYGVAPQYLVAFWGLETAYGRVLGDVPVFDSLATLACDTRRGDYFTTEFVNALHIVDNGIDPDSMIGSWAGAMGQTQFMPSVYLQHAVDGDGDGVADLWGSVPDAFASAASFLRSLGWRPGWRWGREVSLPEGFDYYLAGRDKPLPLAEWRRLGVTTTRGAPIEPLAEDAALLLPSGAAGPAFLVYANFAAIMRWNRSEFFALTVGHLADRIAGAGPLETPPPEDQRVTRDAVRSVQQRLNELGYESGTPDGIAGSATRNAVREWQREKGLPADGFIDTALLQSLEILD